MTVPASQGGCEDEMRSRVSGLQEGLERSKSHSRLCCYWWHCYRDRGPSPVPGVKGAFNKILSPFSFSLAPVGVP